MSTILDLLQKVKLNHHDVPDDWKSKLEFIEQLPTGRKGFIVKHTSNDSKVFFSYAAKIYNSMSITYRNARHVTHSFKRKEILSVLSLN